jgi:hypothetical protein
MTPPIDLPHYNSEFRNAIVGSHDLDLLGENTREDDFSVLCVEIN